ncbi:MAG: pentapeptide repeat-containing protein [Pseudomonadota bacterium]
MKITIKTRFSDAILFEGEYESTRHAVESAIKSNRNLCGANLRGADLRGANLFNADLRGANLYGEKLAVTPIVMTGMRWQVMITAEYLTIGCERHAHGEWRSFDRVEISKMDKGAWDWWQQHKDALLALCEINAAQAKAALEKENAA